MQRSVNMDVCHIIVNLKKKRKETLVSSAIVK